MANGLFCMHNKVVKMDFTARFKLPLFTVAIFLCFYSVHGRLQERDVLLVNREVSVQSGHEVTIDPVNHLRIHVRPGDTCILSVQDFFDLSFKAGSLNLAKVPCNFGPEQLRYIHYGGERILEDTIRVLLRYDSSKETVIIPFSLKFKIVSTPLQIVERNIPLDVSTHMGYSSPIDGRRLAFNFDRENLICKASVISRDSGLPRYGYVANNTNALSNVDCDTFLTLGIKYKHHAQSTSLNKDNIPMSVELFHKNGESIQKEYFQMGVNILFGKKNTPPEPSQNALFIMDSINQFVMTALTPEIISAYDEQTPSDQLLFKITQHLGPAEGSVVNTDNRDIPIFSFFQHEINDLKIAYKPPATDSHIKRVFQFEVTIVDTEGLESDPIPVMAVVEPMNTLSPIITTNTGIQLVEGQSRQIFSPDVLEISDEDNLDDVKIYHIDGLRHGHLELPSDKKYFTPKELAHANIVYQHDDSDTYSDNIIFRMTDGEHDVEFLFPVTVFPKDDNPPILNVNTGLELQKGEIVKINQYALSAFDSDSTEDEINFTLEPPFSKEGVLVKRQFQLPENVESWKYLNGIYEQVINQFTQRDLVDGKIFYRHVGGHSSDVIMDKIRFSLTDAGKPPNKSPVQALNVKILPVDDVPPYLYSNIKLRLVVDEAQLMPLRKRNFRYSDDDTNDREIKFTITKPPYDTFSQGPQDAGRIVSCDDSDSMLSKFTQAEVNHHKVCYQPTLTELGIATRIIQFDYIVEDVSGNILPDQQYTVEIKPVNNKPPVITNAGVVLTENDNVVITTEMLDIQDEDSDPESLLVIVTRVPKHGDLYRRRTILSIGDKFSRNDIQQGFIRYNNKGEDVEVTQDEFVLDVTDGVHYVPVTFKIQIEPSDDEPAKMEGKAISGRLTVEMTVKEGGFMRLDPANFRVSDPDSNVMDLQYQVRTLPRQGSVLVNGRKNEQFTQADIMRGRVTYEHTGGEIGTTERMDMFDLVLPRNRQVFMADGSRVGNILVMIKIKPVNNIAPEVTIGPNLDVLEGEKAEILPSHIDVIDKDSNVNDILCTIMRQPEHGFVENKSPEEGSERSRAGLPISAFSVANMRLGNILYVQSAHKGIEPRQDYFTFQCSDGVNISPKERLTIKIHPSNDEEPEMHVREFIGSEGMVIRVDLPILNAVDKDEPEDVLHFIVTSPPSHGKIIQQSRGGDMQVQNFTLDDIKKFSTILYEHDNSETISDQFELLLTDGKHNVSKTVPIIIFPVDDETPRLSINNGLEIDNLGDSKYITNDILKAEDVDSDIGNITFIIRRVPQFGRLTKRTYNGSETLMVRMNFTQIDIDEKRVQYVHFGEEAKRDLIKFDVTDGLNPLIDRYFYVTVKGMDMIYPEVINHGVKLPQGGVVILSTDILSGTDLNSPDQDLKFIVTRPPNHGYLDYTYRTGVPITEFKQMDLAASRLRYVHNADDEIKMDSFEFEVTDGFNPVSRTFRIALTDVDNKKPVLMFSTLRLKEGGSKLITPFELKAVDSDTTDDKITFTITQVPLHGNLLHNVSRIVSRFTQHDINQNMITYQHDGTETRSDSFTFTVTDGTHSQFFPPGSNIPTRRPQEMDIEIIPVDNGIPQITINLGATYLSPIDAGIGFQFSKRVLRCDDLDSTSENLIYKLSVNPKHGYIQNIKRGRGSTSMWTQEDIDNQWIQYMLRQGENATSDSFFFQVSDKGKNVLANQPFHLNWGWISFRDKHITVNETQEFLEVTLIRRGYLGETCFVTVNVTDQTAHLGKDVSRQFAQQVQFNPGQTEKTWRLPLRDDDVYEKEETIILQITDPVSAVLEYPDVTRVSIVDPEDESTVVFSKAEFSIQEKVGQLQIPIHRTGDMSQDLSVICYTQQDTAQGTPGNKVVSFSDYITRPGDHSSRVRFNSRQDNDVCTITIIDDSLYEEVEKFKVILAQPMGGKVGKIGEAVITIVPDPHDEPVFYFDSPHYTVDESAGTLEVKVWKTGTDLSRHSSVEVRSAMTNPPSAQVGVDYDPVSRFLDFAPGEMTKILQVTIRDDLGLPTLEGIEKFHLNLRAPVGGSIGEPKTAVVSINDTLSDMPKMEFATEKYDVLEIEDAVVATVTRSGDLNHESHVRCYTRQSSALAGIDFEERPNNNDSMIHFKPGEREAECRVRMIDDKVHEVEESFKLYLGTPGSTTAGGAAVGGQNSVRIIIYDDEDKPKIKFEESRYTVNEPIIKGDITILRVPVVRLGDTSATSRVRVHTERGSASGNRDFNPYSRVLEFGPGVERVPVEIEINYDNERENSEIFSLHLSHDLNGIATVMPNHKKATIYIEENSKLADVIFPVQPLVVSLRDLDFVEDAIKVTPPQGYPLICVSPCSPKHPQYPVVEGLCTSSGINDTLTKYRWRLGSPADRDGVSANMEDLETNTFFTSTRAITLDSIYFRGGSRVQCYARAVNEAGQPGKEVASPVVTINKVEGLCPPRIQGAVGADPFTAKLRYTGPDDPSHPNTVRVTIQIPHTDGLLPLVSTSWLSNFDLTISKDSFRLGLHQCSNLLAFSELQTQYGFTGNGSLIPQYARQVVPYQFSEELRSRDTLRFYRNLDLGSCLWTFEAHYGMSELVSLCGGNIETEAQVLNNKQSYVSLRVPLYVSYLYHTSSPTKGWQNFDMNTYLALKFVYNTAVLWQDGVRSPQTEEETNYGYLYPVSMRLQDDGKLVVNFRTEARFRGMFVLSHLGTQLVSDVQMEDNTNQGLFFPLTLLQSDPTYDQPSQMWEFTSSVALKDYSGDYLVHLLPCDVATDQEYSLPTVCQPRKPVTFTLPIRFQQVTDPVPTRFSLNTQFNLVRSKDSWLSDGSRGFDLDEDSSFSPGDVIYGRVDVDPVQSLGDEFRLGIEKVFLCAGKDGYIPRYDPDNGDYGCVTESDKLDTVFRIIDKGAPYTVDDSHNGLEFKAQLATQDKAARDLFQQPGADGFSFSSAPLFQVDSGKQWFLHAIYTIRSNAKSHSESLRKRSIELHQVVRRSVEDVSNIGQDGKGTNMAPLLLNFDGTPQQPQHGHTTDKLREGSLQQMHLIAILVGAGLLLLIGVFLAVILIRYRRKRTSPPPTPSGTITVMEGSGGKTRVISNGKPYSKSSDNTEV